MAKIQKQTKKFLKKSLPKKKKFIKKEAAPAVEDGSEESDVDVEAEKDIGFNLEPRLGSDVEGEEEEESGSETMSDNVEDDNESDQDIALNMSQLKENDPKFYQFLLDNDQQLLEFKEGEDVEEIEDEDEEMEEIDDKLVTSKMIHQWRASIEKTLSIKTLKKIVLAFRAASAFGEDEQDFTYRIIDEKVFNLVLLTAIKYTPKVLDHYIYGEDAVKKSLPSSIKKWKNVKAMAKTFLTSLLKILSKMTSLSMNKFVIKTSEASAAYFACFPKLGKEFMNKMLSLWCNDSHEQVRILAFLSIRKLAITAPNPYLDLTIKGAYQGYLSIGRVTAPHTWTQIQFMENCVVELCGLFLATTYQHIFVALRQLAIQLRQASTTKTKENFKSVYNWQFLHSLRLWARVLCEYGIDQDPKQQLKPLIYPLVQIIIGTMRLKPSSKHFPLKLALIRILIDITEKTQTFIPVASYLLEVFESNEIKSKPKPSTLKPLDYTLNIRAPNQYLGTKTYHSGLVEEVIHLLFQYYSSQATSIAFPELAIPATIQLKRIMKTGKDVTLSRQIQQLLEKLDQNSKYIEKHRNKVTYGPKDIDQALRFLDDSDKALAPIYKHNEARMKIKARQAPQEMMVAQGDDSSEDEKVVKQSGKKQTKIVVDGDEDLLEDFELSDEEE